MARSPSQTREELAVKKQNRVFQFKVRLRDIKPAIWRRIQVPKDASFWDLHVALQDSMGWFDSHLHAFRIRHPKTGAIDEIGIPDDEPMVGNLPCLAGWETAISKYFREAGNRAEYEYDFGDGWEHDLVLEKVVVRIPRKKYPICLAGEYACPPEDCGGIPGYDRLSKIIADPSHEEYESMMQWLGGSFDPEFFDPKEIRFDNPKKRLKMALSDY